MSITMTTSMTMNIIITETGNAVMTTTMITSMTMNITIMETGNAVMTMDMVMDTTITIIMRMRCLQAGERKRRINIPMQIWRQF